MEEDGNVAIPNLTRKQPAVVSPDVQTPAGPVQQQIQIIKTVKTADGKIQVSGLLPGQQVVSDGNGNVTIQMPDDNLKIQTFFNQPVSAQFQGKTGENSVIQTISPLQPQREVKLTSNQPQPVLSNPTQVVPTGDGGAMQSPSKNQTIQRNTPIVEQQSGLNTPTLPKVNCPLRATELIAVRDVYIDGSPVPHGGILICGKTIESFVIMLPDIDRTIVISFPLNELKKIFFYPEKRIFGILFTPEYKHKSMILDMNLAQDDFSYFKDTFFKMFEDIDTPVTILRNQKEAKKYVTSNFPRGIEVWRIAFGKKKLLSRLWDISHPTFEFFRPYLRCYTNFVKENPVKREGKKILRKIDDLPKFLKLNSGSFSLLQPLLFSFLVQHSCRNPRCRKFSYLKCQACRGIYYCGKKCQIEDWNSHREYCQQIQDIRAQVQVVPNLFKTQGNGPISFEAFFSEISYKMFEAVYDSLKNPDFSFLFGKDSILASRDASQLIRRRGIKSRTLKSLMKQVSMAFGEKWDSQELNNMFSAMPKI